MRVLFVTLGPAHVPWIVPLAWASQLAGHEVRVAARPDCVAPVTGAGLIAVPVGDAAATRAAAARPGLGTVGAGRDLPPGWASRPGQIAATTRSALSGKLYAVADMMAGDLVDFGRLWRPDIVVHDSAAVAGPVAGAALGVPALGHTFGASLGHAVQRPEDIDEGYAALFERFGVPPRADPALWIDPCPPALRAPHPVARLDVRYLPYAAPAPAPWWLLERAARPRVCVTGGVTTAALQAVVTAVGAAGDGPAGDYDILLAVTPAQRAELGELAPGVRVLESVPLSAVLPSCQAVVHHGGLGTGLTAVLAGLPQVVLPQSPVQQHWAERITAAGAGLTAAGPAQDAARPEPDAARPGVRDAVAAVLGDAGYRARAAEIRAQALALRSVTEVAGILTDVAEHGLAAVSDYGLAGAPV
jgi:EryCIII-like glycosyltransferase